VQKNEKQNIWRNFLKLKEKNKKLKVVRSTVSRRLLQQQAKQSIQEIFTGMCINSIIYRKFVRKKYSE
jgi:hypothetical protein